MPNHNLRTNIGVLKDIDRLIYYRATAFCRLTMRTAHNVGRNTFPAFLQWQLFVFKSDINADKLCPVTNYLIKIKTIVKLTKEQLADAIPTNWQKVVADWLKQRCLPLDSTSARASPQSPCHLVSAVKNENSKDCI